MTQFRDQQTGPGRTCSGNSFCALSSPNVNNNYQLSTDEKRVFAAVRHLDNIRERCRCKQWKDTCPEHARTLSKSYPHPAKNVQSSLFVGFVESTLSKSAGCAERFSMSYRHPTKKISNWRCRRFCWYIPCANPRQSLLQAMQR